VATGISADGPDKSAFTGLRSKWRPATVNVRQLGKQPAEMSPECAALAATVADTSKKPSQ
jgi:hypothetical protein